MLFLGFHSKEPCYLSIRVNSILLEKPKLINIAVATPKVRNLEQDEYWRRMVENLTPAHKVNHVDRNIDEVNHWVEIKNHRKNFNTNEAAKVNLVQ